MDTIKDRLVRIMTSEGITSSAFADVIGVQRSSISHILSGRNKPSLDFLQKILTKFPKYNAEWLIIGTGDIYKQPKQASFFNNTDSISDKEVDNKDKVPTGTSSENAFTQSLIKEKEELVDNIADKDSSHKQLKKKRTIRIIEFYDDNTFNVYLPS